MVCEGGKEKIKWRHKRLQQLSCGDAGGEDGRGGMGEESERIGKWKKRSRDVIVVKKRRNPGKKRREGKSGLEGERDWMGRGEVERSLGVVEGAEEEGE